MSDAIPVNKKRPGRPRVGSTLVGVRLEPDLLQPLDAYAAQQEGMGRPQAIRKILREWFAMRGQLQAGE